ncbi:MAG: HDIG domain-containing protein [Anaerolineae bacterium]|nr:HDIG domain-containing protein [Anaerolineae bacterium]
MRLIPVLASPEMQQLLDNLAAGADVPLYSVDDWAQRLGNDLLAQQFINQMRDEWLPVDAPNELCKQMMHFVRRYLEQYQGWQHVWAHTLRVTGYALALASEASVDPNHAFIMGVFHDIGKLDELRLGSDTHEEIGAEMLRHQLNGHYPRSVVTLMGNVIAKKASAVNPYTRLVHDADKLDKIGATGLARRLSSVSAVHYIPLALRRVADDRNDFPDMHYPTSEELADGKQQFTDWFLASITRPLDGNTA